MMDIKLSASVLFILMSYILQNYQAQGQPQFNSSTYSTSVYENVTNGTKLDLGIHATGPDDTPVTYSITTAGITAFSIDKTSGVISTAWTLDYETQRLYQFSIGAIDQIMRNSTANVTVTVLDVNDNRPVFGQSEYSATVTEDVVVGTTVTVLALTATDADSGTNGQLSHSITRGNDQGTFRLDSARGTLATATTLDRETTASYNLTVQAIDGGSPALSSSVNVTITVGDVNDNSPVFEQSIYTATLPSDAQKEWSFTVTATDRDSGSNAAITYSIIEGDVAEIFSIDAESGEIHVTCMIDTEKFPSFTLTVQATDGGTPTRLSGQATVMITVDTGTTTSTTATLIFIGDIGGTTTATSCGSAASLHNVKLFLYPLLPLLMLLVSAALGI